MARLSLNKVEKTYPNGFKAVHGVDLEVRDGEFMVFVGPSGCAKSTLLRMIAGLESITAGELRIGDKTVNSLAPKERGIAMVFQNYALYPHMKVYDNLAFGLKLAKTPPAELDRRVRHAARLLEMEHLLDRYPKQLSGGQAQRVAVGRAIVKKPDVFLFDEPLSNLDAALRGQTRVEIAKLHRELGATTIYVTHDQVEAMTLADRVVVLRDGLIEQVGTPLELYDRPANQFVAQFIGTPQMNVVPAVQLPPQMRQQGPQAAADGAIGLRPEAVSVLPKGQGAVSGRVELVEALGAETLLYVRTAEGAQLVARQSERTQLQAGDDVSLNVATDQAHWFDSAGRVVQAAAQ